MVASLTLCQSTPFLRQSQLVTLVLMINSTHLLYLSHSASLQRLPSKVCTDWSRATRKRFGLLQAASDPKQSKVTYYFELISNVQKIADENVDVKRALQVVCGRENDDVASSSQLLNQLLLNAEKNAKRLPQQRRHEEVMKKFSTSLFIYSGPMTYEFLHKNLPTALPSLRTVQRIVRNEYHLCMKVNFDLMICLPTLIHIRQPRW